MTSRNKDELWTDLESWLGIRSREGARSTFWDQLFGEGSDGMFFDAEGNDRTALVKALVTRVDQLETRLAGVADRVAVLERIVVTDETKLSEEIEKLRGVPRT